MTDSSTPSDAASSTALWEFACAFYSHPKIADACLQLQDHWGLNVNILLWCYWLEARGCPLEVTAIQMAEIKIEALDKNYIKPLRAMRTELKKLATDSLLEEMRRHIKRAELLGEHRLLNQLAELSANWTPKSIHNLTSGANARVYLTHLDVTTIQITHTLALFDSVSPI